MRINCEKLPSATLALQREDIDLLAARILLDGLLSEYEHEEFKKYLASDAGIVHQPAFESGVIKVLNKSTLTPEEEKAVEVLRMSENVNIATSTYEDSSSADDFATHLLKTKRRIVEFPKNH